MMQKKIIVDVVSLGFSVKNPDSDQVWDGVIKRQRLATFDKKGIEFGALRLKDDPDFCTPDWFRKLESLYVAQHTKEAKALGLSVYKRGFTYAKVCAEFAESIRV